jgi:hypothetical protein
MTMISYPFSNIAASQQQAQKKNQRSTLSQLCPPRATYSPTHRPTATAAMPTLPKMNLQRRGA